MEEDYSGPSIGEFAVSLICYSLMLLAIPLFLLEWCASLNVVEISVVLKGLLP